MSFEYNAGPIEVFIVNDEEKRVVNGYAETGAVVSLLAPYTRITSAQLWNATHASYKIQNNGKNFVHAVAICRYLSAVPESNSAGYQALRRLVRDLFVGDQKEMDDETRRELADIKKNLDEIRNGMEEVKQSVCGTSILSDFNGLLKIMKSELLLELQVGDCENKQAGVGNSFASADQTVAAAEDETHNKCE